MNRISSLPDELLVKILMSVPTKVDVSTSILSKRWEYLWTWLPELDFCHIDTENSRDPATKSNILPPRNLFTCESLVILKLVGDILLDVPQAVSLPSLRTLKLQRVGYAGEDTLQRLLSNCPILEYLVVELGDDDEEESTGKLTVAVPSLQSLSLYIPYISYIDGYVIETPVLKYLKLMNHSPFVNYCLIENMPYLIEAYLDGSVSDLKSIFGPIASAKRLAICSEMLVEGFVFNQLEHLEVCFCIPFNSDQLVNELLKASSNLKRLDFSFIDQHKPTGMVFWNEPTIVPECIFSSLQSLSWSDYTGEPGERDAVVYILKHAAHLKTATIKSYGSDVRKLAMLNELELSPRASSICQLMFD